jgi:hypothetical protein
MTPRHLESSAFIDASPEDVFALVDDHSRFSSHMSESSLMMGGSRMSVELDEAKGRAVGSHIRLNGRVFGIRLYLDEVVTRREPPTNKVWETVGAPRLLVIGKYSMGVHITPEGGGSRLRVFIDYQLPDGWVTYWLGWLFGRFYAGWCVRQMLSGVQRSFTPRKAAAA